MTGRKRWGLVPVALVAALVTGCGSTDTTVELSPLSARLAQIDQSLASQRFEQARRDLAALATATKNARADGELSSTSADRILDAIIALRATLPVPAPAATPTPTPTPTPVTRPSTTSQTPEKTDGPKKKPGGKGKPKGGRG